MKVLHIITGLRSGGAEGVLYRLCRSDDACKHTVVSLTNYGKYGPMLAEHGIPVIHLNMSFGLGGIRSIARLYSIVRSEQPDIVQTWMYHSDLIGGVVARVAGCKRIVWGIRNSDLDIRSSSKSTMIIARLCAWLSRVIPFRIVVCAEKAKEVHTGLGYAKELMTVIPNGYDLHRFSPSEPQSGELRREFGIPGSIFLIGMVARYDPQKDFNNLLNALSQVVDQSSDVHVMLVGNGVCDGNTELKKSIVEKKLEPFITLIGARTDIPQVMRALDIHVLSSAYGEAFPNVIAEAMACSTPCVTTNVGDSGFIVGDTGWVVEPRECEQLAKAILAAIHMKKHQAVQWSAIKRSARKRIESHFDIRVMISSFHKVWFDEP